jgi:hypothetical protein
MKNGIETLKISGRQVPDVFANFRDLRKRRPKIGPFIQICVEPDDFVTGRTKYRSCDGPNITPMPCKK